MTEDEMNRFIASLSLATPEPEFNVRNLPSPSPYGTIQPDTGMFVGGGGERDVSNEYRNFGISPGFRAGPVSGSATVSTGRDMPTPGVGYSVNAQLPGDFNAGYRRMHAMETPSRYDQHMLSLAREVLGGNVSVGAGDFLFEYSGEQVYSDEGDRRGVFYDLFNRSYLLAHSRTADLDATVLGNKARFVNHSDGAFNARASNVVAGDRRRVHLTATCVVHPGEEILFNYGYERTVHWQKDHRYSQTAVVKKAKGGDE